MSYLYKAKGVLDIFRDKPIVGISAGDSYKKVIDQIGRDPLTAYEDNIHSHGDADVYFIDSTKGKSLAYIGIYPGRSSKRTLNIDFMSFDNPEWYHFREPSHLLSSLFLNSISFSYSNKRDIVPYVKIIDIDGRVEIYCDVDKNGKFKLERIILYTI